MLANFRNDEMGQMLERVVEIGLRGGWAEFEGTPLMLPRIQLVLRIDHTSSVDDNKTSWPLANLPGNVLSELAGS